MTLRGPLVFVVLGVSSAVPGYACSDVPPLFWYEADYAVNFAAEMPTNGTIRLAGWGRSEERIEGAELIRIADGMSMPMTATWKRGSALDGATLLSLQPDELLDPDTEYEVWRYFEGSEPEPLDFHTTGGVDDNPPAPVEVVELYGYGGAPSSPLGLVFTLTESEDDSAGLVYEVELGFGDDPPQTIWLTNPEADLYLHYVCGNLQILDPTHEDVTLRARAVDIAGNRSSWSEPWTSKRCSCEHGPGGLSIAWIVGLLAMLRREP